MSHNNRHGYRLVSNQVDEFVDPSWRGTWKYDLFACCDEPALCISALPCTCYYCYLEKVVEFTIRSRTYDPANPGCGCLGCMSASLDVISLCSFSACCMQHAHEAIRSRYYLGAAAGDETTACCRFWFCKPCAMTQLLRELKHRGEDVGALGCASSDGNNGGAPRPPHPPRIYNLNPAEIQLELAGYKNYLPQAQQSGNTALANAILRKIGYLTDATALSVVGGPEEAVAKQIGRLDPMVMFAAMSQPADPQRYQTYTEMKNMYRQVQETQDGQWSFDQRNRYQGMEQEMLRPRAQQVPVGDANQVMMGMMQMGMMPPQQMQMGMMPQQQQQQPGFYSPPPPPPPPQNNFHNNNSNQNGWNL